MKQDHSLRFFDMFAFIFIDAVDNAINWTSNVMIGQSSFFLIFKVLIFVMFRFVIFFSAFNTFNRDLDASISFNSSSDTLILAAEFSTSASIISVLLCSSSKLFFDVSFLVQNTCPLEILFAKSKRFGWLHA